MSPLLLVLAFAVQSPPLPGYSLAWHDEFDGTALDTTKWEYRGLGPRRDAINTRDAVTVSGGMLHITTTKVGDEYHTGMIATSGKYSTAFGYFEARLRLQKQVGHWSAFWLQSPQMGQVGDPQKFGTEIDVIEYLRREEETAQINLHWDGYGKNHKHAGTQAHVDGLGSGFHTFGLEWTPVVYRFFVDGREVWKTDKAVSHLAEFMLLSIEVGDWAGDIKGAELPDGIDVDWVRVWKKEG
ncbi:MAG TPA: glycoside hydrolase family 16 protein [Fimbriimonadaceae bacterium]|nr:glycoside hydrolase family 16 protein [Fimbriimonadaceae bacterium]